MANLDNVIRQNGKTKKVLVVLVMAGAVILKITVVVIVQTFAYIAVRFMFALKVKLYYYTSLQMIRALSSCWKGRLKVIKKFL